MHDNQVLVERPSSEREKEKTEKIEKIENYERQGKRNTR